MSQGSSAEASVQSVVERLRSCIDGNWSCMDLGRAEAAALLAYIKALQQVSGCQHPEYADRPMCHACDSLLNDEDRAAAQLLKGVP